MESPGYANVFEAVKKGDLEKVNELVKTFRKAGVHSTEITTGKNRNSICHVASKYGQVDVLKEYGDKLIKTNFKNKVGNSWLHEAAKRGQTEAAVYIIENFQKALNNDVNEQGETFIDVALSIAQINPNRSMRFIQELDQKISLKKVFEVIFPTSHRSAGKGDQADGSGEEKMVGTFLHKIAACGFSELVSCFYYLGWEKEDEKGNTVFHEAASHGRLGTLQELVRLGERQGANRITSQGVKLKDVINHKNSNGETCLHVAMKSLNSEIVKFLIFNRADLDVQDSTKNTPLHDLVAKATSDESNIGEFIKIWKVVVDNIVVWWCRKYGLKTPSITDLKYKIYQRDALYYIRSEIPNGQNLSVIQLAASRGLVRFVREMIWVENVFVEHSENDDTVTINVTNLMPHLKGGQNIKYRKENDWVSFDELEMGNGGKHSKTEKDPKSQKGRSLRKGKSVSSKGKPGAEDENYEDTKTNSLCRCGCLLNTLLEMEHSNKANEIFNMKPMKQLVRDHWFVHQWWTVVMLLSHLVYMAFYGSYSLNTIQKIYAENRTSELTADELRADRRYLIWPVFLVVIDLLLFWTVIGIQSSLDEKRRGTWIKTLKRLLIEDVKIDGKDIFNWPSVFLSVCVISITSSMPVLFCCTTIIGLALNINLDAYTYVTTLSLALGWLLTFYWASAFEPVYRFLKALKFIILKDVVSFLIFYIFVLLAFSNAIYANMTWVPSLMEQYDNVNDVIYELLLVGCGASSRMSDQDLANEFEKLGYKSLLFTILFTTYIFITLVGLLNLIIASMCHTYESFARTDHEGYRQHSLMMSRISLVGFFIGSNIIQPIFQCCKMIDKFVEKDEDESGHYVITINAIK